MRGAAVRRRTAFGQASGTPHGEAVHATAVAIGEAALLVLGPSRSGKSRLALALIAASTPASPVTLVGDDRVLLGERNGRLCVKPHPRIAGFLERRDFGFLAMPFVASAPVGGIVALGRTTSIPARLHNFPCLEIVDVCARPPEAVAGSVMAWWRGAGTTPFRKPRRPQDGPRAKD